MTARPTGLGPCDLLTDEELARYLGCGREKALEWANARRLAVPTPGRGVRFPVVDVLEALRRERDGVKVPPPVRRRTERMSQADVDR